MFLKSTDCTDIFPNNNASHFYVRLPEAVDFSQNADGPVFNFGQNLLYVGVKSVLTDIIEVGVLDGDSFDYVNFSTGTLYCAFHVD